MHQKLVMFQLIDDLAITVKPSSSQVDSRQCVLCHQMEDGETDGAGR